VVFVQVRRLAVAAILASFLAASAGCGHPSEVEHAAGVTPPATPPPGAAIHVNTVAMAGRMKQIQEMKAMALQQKK
jgi:hypothetical protein